MHKQMQSKKNHPKTFLDTTMELIYMYNTSIKIVLEI